MRQLAEGTSYWRQNPDAEDVMPATHYQDWALSCGFTRHRAYNNYFIFKFESEVDPIVLQEACQRWLDRHSALRTSFAIWQCQTYQVVWKPIPVQFFLDECKAGEISTAVDVLIQTDLREVLLCEVIARFFLVQQREQQRDTLIIRLSHAQYDGISLPALLRDLIAAYEQRPFSSSIVPFSTYVNTVYRSVKKRAETYWQSLLQGSSMTKIVAYTQPSVRSTINQTVTWDIRMPRLPPGITVATALKACWDLTLARLTGLDDVVFGQVTSGRSTAIPNAESIAGPCINIIPVRVRSNAQGNLRPDHQLLREVQAQALAGIPHETMGFRHIIDRCTSWPK